RENARRVPMGVLRRCSGGRLMWRKRPGKCVHFRGGAARASGMGDARTTSGRRKPMISRFRSMMLVTVAGLMLAGCKQESTGSAGALTLSLSNAALTPVIRVGDLRSVAHVYVTLQEVDVHLAAAASMEKVGGADDEGGQWISAVLPAERTFDLM